ncbi:MAG TPA: hypothetical protein VL326_22375 [Kofleriaceae bacterium]|nr:hypothetical protein [Kofleriaceae bacterium]
MKRWMACAVFVIACGKGGAKKDESVTGSAATGSAAVGEKAGSAAAGSAAVVAKAPDPACSAKVKELVPWLTDFELETSSYEIDFGYKLQPIARAPMPVSQHGDDIEIRQKSIEGFDDSEHNHADSKLGANPAQKAVEERLAAMHGMANENPDRIRIDVDQKALWKDVVRVVNAAEKAGYKEAVFAFTATSKLPVPAGLEPWTQKSEDVDAAGKRIEDMQATCKEWRSASYSHAPKPSPLEDAQALASELAAGIEKCNCAVDIEEVKTQMFKAARWKQAVPRAGVTISIGPGDKSVEVAAAGSAPWSEAHAKLVESVAEGVPSPPTIRFKAK